MTKDFAFDTVRALIESVPEPLPLNIPRPDDYPVRPTLSTGRFHSASQRLALEAAINAAQLAYNQLAATLEIQAETTKFLAVKAKLKQLRDEYESLLQLEKEEIERLNQAARDRQMKIFLATVRIDTFTAIGPTRRSILSSSGIETAADIREDLITQIPGMSSDVVSALLSWRAEAARHFRFDPAETEAATAQVRTRYAVRRVAMEADLSDGVDTLRAMQQGYSKAQELLPGVIEAAKRIAQLKCDYAAMK